MLAAVFSFVTTLRAIATGAPETVYCSLHAAARMVRGLPEPEDADEAVVLLAGFTLLLVLATAFEVTRSVTKAEPVERGAPFSGCPEGARAME
jgi:hypothetical protein